ncbi:MAG: J domain-containing protein [Opitutaceae bacterium]|jgi:hypothetical protein|nr:J domain-containing protein [Opitutaceae bacterium]
MEPSAKLRTHYDNLKVSRDAPPEVIRAAYRSLAQKYHPDKNPGFEEDAHRIMRIINASFAVLDTPDSRAAHDSWIAAKERESAAQSTPPYRSPVVTTVPSRPPDAPRARKSGQYGWRSVIVGGGIIIGLMIWAANSGTSPESVLSRPYSPPPPKSPAPQKPAYVRSETTPAGYPWPYSAMALKGFTVYHNDGRSEVTIDNSRNSSDVFIKLVSLDYKTPTPVRHFFIPKYGSYTCKSIRQGTYDIRYRDLDSGAISKSSPFTLEETRTSEVINYSS